MTGPEAWCRCSRHDRAADDANEMKSEIAFVRAVSGAKPGG